MARHAEILATGCAGHTVEPVPEVDDPNAAHLLMSGCAPDGSVLVVRCPVTTKLLVSFDDDGSTRDHTSWMADFAMIGWFHASTEAPAPVDGVEVAHLELQGAGVDDVEAWWIHPAAGMSYGCNGSTLLRHVARGISVQIAEAVATEILEDGPVPADTGPFTEPHPEASGMSTNDSPGTDSTGDATTGGEDTSAV